MNISKEEREKDQKSLQWHSNELQSLIKKNDSLKEENERLKNGLTKVHDLIFIKDLHEDGDVTVLPDEIDFGTIRDLMFNLLNTPKPPKV